MTQPVSAPVPRHLFAGELARLLRLLVTNPREAVERIPRVLGVLRAQYLFRHCNCGALIVALGQVDVHVEGTVTLGDRVQFAGGMFPTTLHAGPAATIRIGAETLLSYGAAICAVERVEIGARCQIASLVTIRDRSETRRGPVIIGDDVWIAYGAIVEPGVTIGHDSVIGAGSVVVTDIPAFSLASGNPAVAVPLRGAPLQG